MSVCPLAFRAALPTVCMYVSVLEKPRCRYIFRIILFFETADPPLFHRLVFPLNSLLNGRTETEIKSANPGPCRHIGGVVTIVQEHI